MRRLSFAFLLLVAGAGVAIVQPLQDPWHRPLSPQGQSAGITYGTTAPSLASTGMNPGQGEVWMDTDGATDGGPIMQVYDHVNTAWDAVLNSAALTANTIPVFNGLELIDSTVTDDATDVLASGGLFTSGTAVGAANSFLLDGNNGEFVLEGDVADGAEIEISAFGPAADLHVTFSNPAVNTGGFWMTLENPEALAVQDAGDIFRGIYLNLDSPADHDGLAFIRGIDLSNDAATATGEETGLYFNAGWNAEIHFANATATLWWLETGNFTLQDYGGDMQFILEDVPAAGDSNNLVEINATLNAMDDGADIQRGLLVNITNAIHANGNLHGIFIDAIVASAATEHAMRISTGWDVDVSFANAAAVMQYNNAGNLTFRDAGSAATFTLRDVPAISTSVDLVEINATTVQLDAGDTVRGLFVDLVTSAATTGGNFYGIEIDGIVARAAAENAIRIGANYDVDVFFEDATARMAFPDGGVFDILDAGGAIQFFLRDVPAAGTGADLQEFDVTLSAMDGAGDLFRTFYVDIANADHTNGFMYAGYFDNDTNDADAFEGGLYINGGFDGHLVMEAAAASPADNPPASTIALYIDDQTDWSGGGGNDCALIAKDSGGATDIVATLVLNGACP